MKTWNLDPGTENLINPPLAPPRRGTGRRTSTQHPAPSTQHPVTNY